MNQQTDQPDPTAWTGGEVGEGIVCVVAANPSAMTLDGTNTWLLHRPGAREAVVVDPGPAQEEHLQRVAAVAAERGLRVGLVLVTHGHHDHIDGLERFADIVGAPVAFPGSERAGAHSVEVDGLRVEAVPTPGHTHDSFCYYLPQAAALLTGDTILGRGTTVVTWPDGALAPYLRSLDELRALAEREHVRVVLPGHGAPVREVLPLIDYYVTHRHERLDQVRAVLAGRPVPPPSRASAEPEPVARGESVGREPVAQEPGSPARPGEPVDDELGRLVEHVVETVYTDAPRQVWPAARQSVRAQLEYLREHP